MKNKFIWDHLSDQPHIIRDKKFKAQLKREGALHHLKSLVVAIVFLPFVLAVSLFIPYRKKNINTEKFMGLGVSLDNEPEHTPEFIADLNVKNILVRVPLWDVENIGAYVEFCKKLLARTPEVVFHFVILQDRAHAKNYSSSTKNLHIIFENLHPFSCSFQLGNATNRLKWGFISVEDSLNFFSVAQKLKQRYFPNIELTGSSVIDFEPVSTVRSLYHLFPIHFNKVAALLYVDRRGAPESKQGFVFDLRAKIKFVYTAMRFSPKANNRLIITETNWPLKNKEGYAPAKGECQVSEEAAASYLVRYYLLALSTGMVESVYWHQLFAPGYGLVDNRDSTLRKMPAYYAFKYLVTLLKAYQFQGVVQHKPLFEAIFTNKTHRVLVKWSKDIFTLNANPAAVYFDVYGNRLDALPQALTNALIYEQTLLPEKK